jgi:phytoene synthase
MRAVPEQLAAWQQSAAEATAKGSKSFYFATRFFPPHLAQAAYGVYWFCRSTDDIVDENPDLPAARRELEAWREQLVAVMNGQTVDSPVLMLFEHTRRQTGFPEQYPLELIEGMRMDLERARYANFTELRLFCYRVASVVGLMMSHVIGFRGDALTYAEELGIAMQLTNILRDLGEDADRGRIYLPADELARFGYSEADLLARRRGPAFDALMRFQIDRARGYYERSFPGIPLLKPEGRFAVEIAAKVYRDILGRIETMDYNVYARRAVVPTWKKYAITAGALARRKFQS